MFHVRNLSPTLLIPGKQLRFRCKVSLSVRAGRFLVSESKRADRYWAGFAIPGKEQMEISTLCQKPIAKVLLVFPSVSNLSAPFRAAVTVAHCPAKPLRALSSQPYSPVYGASKMSRVSNRKANATGMEPLISVKSHKKGCAS